MPERHQAIVAETLSKYRRPCWLPILGTPGEGAEAPNRFGGGMALMAPGASWPMHEEDGEPLSLVLQLDTDALPAQMQAKFGGAGMVFQLFLPMDVVGDDPRSFEFTEDNDVIFWFDVRVTPKTVQMIEAPAPLTTLDLPQIPGTEILEWQEAQDTPFLEDEPDLPPPHAVLAEDADWVRQEIDRLLSTKTEPEVSRELFGADELLEWPAEHCVWGTKIGGHPALEQGPQVPHDFTHILQIVGESTSPTGHEVAFDGHGWLCLTPDGEWFWYTVTS